MEPENKRKAFEGKTTIVQEIESLHKRVENLEKNTESIRNYMEWGFSFLVEVREVVGIDSMSSLKEKSAHPNRAKDGARLQ